LKLANAFLQQSNYIAQKSRFNFI